MFVDFCKIVNMIHGCGGLAKVNHSAFGEDYTITYNVVSCFRFILITVLACHVFNIWLPILC